MFIPSELFVLFLLFTVNILGLSGLKTNKHSLLLPWLVIYFIGFISSYIIVFSNYYYNLNIINHNIIGLSFNAVLFNIVWMLVYRTFKTINDETNNMQ